MFLSQKPPSVIAYCLTVAESRLTEAGFRIVVKGTVPRLIKNRMPEIGSGKYRVVRQKLLPDMPDNVVELVVVPEPVQRG